MATLQRALQTVRISNGGVVIRLFNNVLHLLIPSDRGFIEHKALTSFFNVIGDPFATTSYVRDVKDVLLYYKDVPVRNTIKTTTFLTADDRVYFMQFPFPVENSDYSGYEFKRLKSRAIKKTLKSCHPELFN